MKKKLNILGLIGARSGSKSIPDKNIKILLGKPLMAWIIEAANRSKYINRLIVSTDSEKYSKIARKFGAETPFIRPKKFSRDDSLDIEYVSHAVNWLGKKESYVPDIVVRLHPTVPLQEAGDIDKCIEVLLSNPKATSAVVVAEARQHPHKALKIVRDKSGEEKIVTYISESGHEVSALYRQKFPKAYFRANVIVSPINTIKNLHSLTGENPKFYIIPQERAIDIDTKLDFEIAEFLMKKFKT